MRFLDTNILIRHLAKDDPRKSLASKELLRRIEGGEEAVILNDIVVFETVYILESPRKYGLSRTQIKESLGQLLTLNGLRLPNKRLYPRTFDLYCETNISFADAFNTAFMESEGITEIYTYDTDFNKIRGIKRVEP